MNRSIASAVRVNLLTAVSGVVLLSLLGGVNPAAAQLKISEAIKNSRIQGRVDPSRHSNVLERAVLIPRGWPVIDRFHAKRDPRGIIVKGEFRYVATVKMDGVVDWKLSRLDGDTWTRIQWGRQGVTANSKYSVVETIPASFDAVRLKLDMSSGQPDSIATKEFTLPAKQKEYVVRYGTGGKWVPVEVFSSDGDELTNNLNAEYLLLTERAKKLENAFQGTGLQTQRATKTKDYGFGFWSIQVAVFARTEEEWLERTFSERQEADGFRRILINLVRNNGLTVEDIVVR